MKTETTTGDTLVLQGSTLVIFGITGDLAQRKLLPALYHLAKQNLLPDTFKVVGVTRRNLTQADLEKSIRESVHRTGKQVHHEVLEKVVRMIEVFQMDLTNTDDYRRLRERLDALEDEAGMCMHRLFYLAIPAQTFEPLVNQLGAAGLNKSCQHGTGASRLLIEKPFGYDLQSAGELIAALGKHFDEEQIYRIDHYLAKETAQNVLNFRFQNPLFRRVWDKASISSVMITAAEEIDIEGRATFYEQTGALRDLVQSHLLQLLALTTMEEPKTLDAGPIHEEKLRLLQNIKPIAPNMVATQAVRGQYEGYRQEVNDQRSLTETFAALRLEIDNKRWRGVPILLRTGKALAEKVIDINIVFTDESELTRDNVLAIRIQPNEGISLRLQAKKPGLANEVETVQMDFCYGRSFAGKDQPDAYERVLIDAFRGDKTLFATSDEVLASWRILENVIHEWSKNADDLHAYQKGSWGPAASANLAKHAGSEWLTAELKICS